MTSANGSGHGRFGLIICCIDGRNIKPLQDWVAERFPDIDHIDCVTAAGMDGILSGRIAGELIYEGVATQAADWLTIAKSNALISLSAHGPKFGIVSGHEGCAANDVSREEHIEDIRTGAEKMRSWDKRFAEIPIYGLYVNQIDDKWVVECVTGNDAQVSAA